MRCSPAHRSGGAGAGPLFTLWDRTRGRQNVRCIASLGNFPYCLVSNRLEVCTIADLTDKDRIAPAAVGVSVQARILQLASAQLWMDEPFAALDALASASSGTPHPALTPTSGSAPQGGGEARG